VVIGELLGWGEVIYILSMPKGFSSVILSLMRMGTLHCEPLRHGTRMRWSWDVELCGAFRLLSLRFSRIGQHEEAMIWAGLKQVLEHQGRAFARAEDGV
jgi:hypothetical protein